MDFFDGIKNYFIIIIIDNYCHQKTNQRHNTHTYLPVFKHVQLHINFNMVKLNNYHNY